MPLLRPSALALLLLAPFALADETKTDPRVKAVEEQLEADTKAVIAPTQKVKEAYLKAYQAECAARAKMLEKAIASCERKLKAAKDANAKESAAALEAKMEELKVELETWKANEGKKWDVALEEKKEEAKQEEPTKVKNKAEDIVGVWKTRKHGAGQVWETVFHANGTCQYTGGKPGTWYYKNGKWFCKWDPNGTAGAIVKTETGFKEDNSSGTEFYKK